MNQKANKLSGTNLEKQQADSRKEKADTKQEQAIQSEVPNTTRAQEEHAKNEK